MSLPIVNAARYVTSMREGGSLPSLIEASDGRMYVVKMRGAGQGPRVLAAEIITGEVARALGLPVPRIALITLDAAFGKTEPDAEIQDLFKRSVGLNVGLEFMPSATVFDPVAGDVASTEDASRTVWLDAFTMNVDRTPRNANLLWQSGCLWLIDHGASLIFHFDWPSAQQKAKSAFAKSKEHILLKWASNMAAASVEAKKVLTDAELHRILALVPDEFLPEDDGVSLAEQRDGYFAFLKQRLENSAIFEKEIDHARAQVL